MGHSPLLEHQFSGCGFPDHGCRRGTLCSDATVGSVHRQYDIVGIVRSGVVFAMQADLTQAMPTAGRRPASLHIMNIHPLQFAVALSSGG